MIKVLYYLHDGAEIRQQFTTMKEAKENLRPIFEAMKSGLMVMLTNMGDHGTIYVNPTYITMINVIELEDDEVGDNN